MLVILDLKGFQDTNEQRLRAVKALKRLHDCEEHLRCVAASESCHAAIQPSDSAKRFETGVHASNPKQQFETEIECKWLQMTANRIQES